MAAGVAAATDAGNEHQAVKQAVTSTDLRMMRRWPHVPGTMVPLAGRPDISGRILDFLLRLHVPG